MLLAGLGGALVVIGILFAVIVATNTLKHSKPVRVSPAIVAIAIVAVGISCLVVARRIDPPLNASSDDALAASYRSRFFLWVGFGEAPAFLGLLALVATHRYWCYPLGAVFAFIAYARIAPTAAHLAQDQQQINRSGTVRSLRAALATAPQNPRRGLWR